MAPARRHEGDVGVRGARSRAASSSNRVSAPAGRFPRTVLAGADQRLGTLSGARSERMTAASAETLSRTPGSNHRLRAWRSRCAQGCARRPPSHARRPGRCQLPPKEPACDRPTAPVSAQPESAQRVHVPRRCVEHACRLPRSAASSVALGEQTPDRLLDQRAHRALRPFTAHIGGQFGDMIRGDSAFARPTRTGGSAAPPAVRRARG